MDLARRPSVENPRKRCYKNNTDGLEADSRGSREKLKVFETSARRTVLAEGQIEGTDSDQVPSIGESRLRPGRVDERRTLRTTPALIVNAVRGPS